MTLLNTRPQSLAPSDVDLLFKEARQRRRRRRIAATAIVAAVVAVSTTAVALTQGGGSHAQPPVRQQSAPKPTVTLPGSSPRIAWVDYSDRVHIGSLKTGEERVVASGPEASNSSTTQMVTSGNMLFWDTGRGVFYNKATKLAQAFDATVMVYDTVTGRTRSFAPGYQVFNAVDSTDVFVDTDGAGHLVRYTLDGRVVAQLTLPSGWFLPDPFGLGSSPALAHGEILVQSQPPGQAASAGAKSSRLAVWTPTTGNIRVLGDLSFMVATYTDGRGSDSLVAWLPGSCQTNQNCPLQLTDLGSATTRQIRSPYGFGFDMRGSFSPDGRQLAAFTRTNSGGYNPETRLALINVATGNLRPVLGATIAIGEGVGWAQWLPGSQVISGGMCAAIAAETDCFHTDGTTLHTVPQRLGAGDDQELNNSTGVSYPTNANYSTVALP
jgi:hypothetical protein